MEHGGESVKESNARARKANMTVGAMSVLGMSVIVLESAAIVCLYVGARDIYAPAGWIVLGLCFGLLAHGHARLFGKWSASVDRSNPQAIAGVALMAQATQAQNEVLAARIARLEDRVAELGGKPSQN